VLTLAFGSVQTRQTRMTLHAARLRDSLYRDAFGCKSGRIPNNFDGERGRNRTYNLLIKSQLLCQLSYAPGGLGKALCASRVAPSPEYNSGQPDVTVVPLFVGESVRRRAAGWWQPTDLEQVSGLGGSG
jgi:hypothetical protein